MGFMPGAVRARLKAGQDVWLGELRRVTVLFVNLPDFKHTTPLDQIQQTFRDLQSLLYRL